MTPLPIQFRPVSDSHSKMLLRWLSTPEVREWWGDPDKELNSIMNREEPGTGDADGYIVQVNETPSAYIQSWDATKLGENWKQEEPWLEDVPKGTLGIDILIGEPNMIGKGLGGNIIRAFSEKLFSEGAKRLMIDPDAGNKRAIKAYTKAGFTPFDEYWNNEGGTILMELTLDKFEATHD
ncbi:MAG: acetyltransferase [Rhodobacteraceae bacterium]|nr:acetyltransferase [Paracoccaceae bacterium]